MKIYMIIFCSALSACSLTPELAKPVAPIPAAYRMDTRNVDFLKNTQAAADLGWRTMFSDPRLQRLIELSLQNNRDLRIATLNVDAVQSQFRSQRASQLPSAEVSGGVSRERSSVSNGNSTAPSLSSTHTQHTLSLGMSAFEIDLFGRVRSLTDAAFARYLASEQGRRSVQISLVASVADAYFAERLAQSQLELAEHTLVDWTQSLYLARRLKLSAQNSEVDVVQAEGQVAIAEADLESRSRALAQATNAINLLVGMELPDDLPKPRSLNEQLIMTRLPIGLPSDLLVRRPDILQAEQNLVASNADIGAARAAFFPKLSLTASMGFASPALSNLFNTDHRTWRFSPQITQPIFQGAGLRAELRLAEVRKSLAIAQYERAIQTAFKEVADGLAGSATYGQQVDAQMRVVISAKRRLGLSSLRYFHGYDGRLEVLDAQRQLYIAEQNLLIVRRDEIGNVIALYKALGGGFSPSDVNDVRDIEDSH